MSSPQWTSGDVPDQLLPAVARLHASSCDEQLAGAHALAALAVQWYSDGANVQAQRCIDALCAYLRVRRYPRFSRLEQSEFAVREQITCVLTEFLRSGLGAVQGGILVNLAGVRIQGCHVFDGVSFGPGLRLILDRAQLEEDSRLSFDRCHFHGCIVRLHQISLQRNAVLSLVDSTVDAGAWLFASTASVHPTARVDVRALRAPQTAGTRPAPWRGTPVINVSAQPADDSSRAAGSLFGL